MINLIRKSIFLLTLSLVISQLFAQSAYLTILDKKTKEPVPFAHVLFENPASNWSDYAISDMDGKALNKARTFNDNITISFIGYETYESTVRQGETKTIYLVPEIFNVGETVVTGQYTPQKVDKSIYKIEVIGAKQIEEKGANDLGELLQGESNIQIQQDGVLGSSLKMQGLTGENVKLLVDGVPIIGRMNGNIDLGQIDLSNVDHVEIVEGPMSVIYGTNALAGTINIITKENTRNSFLSQINSYYETVGKYNFDGSVSVNKNLHTLSFSGGRNFFDGFSLDNTLRTPAYKPKEQYKGNINYMIKHNELKLKLNSTLFKEKIQFLGAIDTIVAANQIIANDQYFYTTRLTNDLQFNSPWGKYNYITLLGAYSTYIRAKKTFVKDFSTLEQTLSIDPTRHDTTTFNSVMTRGFISHNDRNDKFESQIGFDINLENGKGKRITDSVKTRIDDYAGFISIKYKLTPNINLQPGLRYIYNTKFKAPLIPSFNFQWTLLEKINMRASYAKGFRAPSLKELYLNFVDANHNIHGNADLKAETNDSYNFSTKYALEKNKHSAEMEISGFFNDGKNVIALIIIDPNKLYYKNENVDIRKTKGGRINFNYSFYPALTIKTGFSLTGLSETLTLPSVDSTFIENDNEWVHLDSTFLTNFQYTKDLSVNLSYKLIYYDVLLSAYYKYNGKTTALFTDYDNNGEEFVNRYEVDPYHTLDISLTKKFIKNKLKIVVGAKNLFNNTTILTTGRGGSSGGHSSSSGSSPVGWGRTYFIKMSYKISKY
ncbi:MAG: TonB-dependent receptor [Chlorobi bacterium]|nr:TonB-dependent receptor [Chlorobiota bacterium]